MTKTTCTGAFLFVLALLLGASPAVAHSLHVFAEGDGTVIRGKAYFRGGSPAIDAQVMAFGPEGRKLGEARTDAQGAFTLPAPYRCDYRLLVVTDDGHGAEFRVPAEELSATLPPPGGDGDAGEHGESHGGAPAAPAAPAEVPPAPGRPGPVAEELAAIRSQISSLREQLAQYEQRTRLRDALGGIGYILGLAGIGFYVAARRAERVRKA